MFCSSCIIKKLLVLGVSFAIFLGFGQEHVVCVCRCGDFVFSAELNRILVKKFPPRGP